MNFSDLVTVEKTTETYTSSIMPGFVPHINQAIDTLIQIQYFIGPQPSIKTFAGRFYSYCSHQFIHIPTSIRACTILISKGHYLEASFDIRFLVETLIRIKYLGKHRGYITRVWTNKKVKIGTGKSRRNLTIKDMFEEVCPDLYKIHYGMLLSGFSHGSAASMLYATTKAPGGRTARMGPQWNESAATFNSNYLTVLCLAYLKLFPNVFSSGFSSIEPSLHAQYKGIVSELEKNLASHKKANPKSEKWYKIIDPLLK